MRQAATGNLPMHSGRGPAWFAVFVGEQNRNGSRELLRALEDRRSSSNWQIECAETRCRCDRHWRRFSPTLTMTVGTAESISRSGSKER